jgi:hypothetical protein
MPFPCSICFSLAIAALVGCSEQAGPKLARVSGVVTLDGQPVQGAGLEFIGEAGGVAYGKTDASGRYQMSFGQNRAGALVGKNLVRISSSDKVVVGDKKYESTQVFPKKYNANSDQYVHVAPGSNTLDFACESAGFKPRQDVSKGGD